MEYSVDLHLKTSVIHFINTINEKKHGLVSGFRNSIWFHSVSVHSKIAPQTRTRSEILDLRVSAETHSAEQECFLGSGGESGVSITSAELDVPARSQKEEIQAKERKKLRISI